MIGKQYFLQIKPANHAERFRRLRNGLQRSVALACNLYQAPLRPNEDEEDRAVLTIHRLWDLALDNLLDAWDGDPAELVDYVRSTVELKFGPVTTSAQNVVGVPVVGVVMADRESGDRVIWLPNVQK